MRLSSPRFKDYEEMPKPYTGEGDDKNPPLDIVDVPRRTIELALICEDPDAPTRKPFAHWVIYGIPAGTSRIPEGLMPKERLDDPIDAKQGLNSEGTIGYEGPYPPKGHGWHRYFFRIYALDRRLALPPGATRDDLVEAMMGHVLGEAQTVARYKREVVKRAA